MHTDQKFLIVLVVFVLFAAIALVYIGNGGSLTGNISGNFESQALSGLPVYPGSRLVTANDIAVPDNMRSLVSPFAKWERFTSAASVDDVSIWLNKEFTKQGFQKNGYRDGVQAFVKGPVSVALYLIIINSETNYVIAR